jgi:hypothetical protein
MSRARFACSALALVALFACGGEVSPSTDASTSSDTGASDTGAIDTGAIDASPDAAPDASPDAPPPDTGTSLTAACAAAGGAVCTDMRWDICPAGYEPVAGADAHLGCGSGGGWCCQIAPNAPCNLTGSTNCVVGSCTGCWMAVTTTGLFCESGRSCCQDACD